MSSLNFIRNQIRSVNRFFIKKKVVRSVLDSGHQHQGVANIYRISEDNVGDLLCAPHLYFNELDAFPVDILNFKQTDKRLSNEWVDHIVNNALIIGGGGLLNRKDFEKQLSLFGKLKEKGKKTVLWGAGHNSPNKRDFKRGLGYSLNLNDFGLVGLRDYHKNRKDQWVPCVSCMHPAFDLAFEETQELGIVLHRNSIRKPKLLDALKQFPLTSNTTNLEEMLGMIGASRIVLTDSYHAMYWAMLLGKKVLVVPNSSKFYDFKYRPVFTTFEDFEKDLKKATAYDGLLEECRSINIAFAKKVKTYLYD